MKPLAIILAFVITFANYNATAQTEKVLVKTLRTENINSVYVEMSGEIEVKTWSNDYARILINIKHNNANPNLMKVLITKGRYSVNPSAEDGILTLSSKDLETPLVFGNNETILDETISYTLVVPEGVKVKLKNPDQLVSND